MSKGKKQKHHSKKWLKKRAERRALNKIMKPYARIRTEPIKSILSGKEKVEVGRFWGFYAWLVL